MRLTLRTLLAYLDDTLEPVQAKEIGQKVAESDAARELIERIKQVTRRRRIAAPPLTGPGSKLDPNTIAEYLDNEIAPEAASDVEAICLSSDVHLAEVAGCHQILTLVLGEPMTVPPTAKQRMYGLVKGPEAIPFRKPPAPTKDKEPETGTTGRDVDDTLRLGLPAVGAKGGMGGKVLLFGGGFVAACLLLVAVWMLLNMSGSTPSDDASPPVVATGDKKDKDKEGPAGKDKDKDSPKDKTSDDKDKVKDGEEKGKDGKVDEKTPPRLAEFAFKDADFATDVKIGAYQPEEAKDSSVCLQQEGKEWKRLTSAHSKVWTGRPLLSLPGSWSKVHLDKGLSLTLCGNMPEIFGTELPWFEAPFPLYESQVVLHHHNELDKLDKVKLALDMTLQRGQCLITNLEDEPLQVRVRFTNTWKKPKNYSYEILLHEKGTQVMLAITGLPPPDEPYSPDPDDPRRTGPITRVMCVVVSGFANVKMVAAHGAEIDAVENFGRGPVHLFFYDSIIGARPARKLKDALFVAPELAPPPEVDERAKAGFLLVRKSMKEARTNLAHRLDSGPVKVRLYEILDGTKPSEPVDPKAPNYLRIMLTRLTIRCLGAVEDISSLIGVLDPPKNDEARRAARDALIHWSAADRKNDGALFHLLAPTFGEGPSKRILRLIHGFTRKELEDPSVFKNLRLIEGLNEDTNALIREFSFFRLYEAFPPGWGIPYSAGARVEDRRKAADMWRGLIPEDKGLPSLKKGPEKEKTK